MATDLLECMAVVIVGVVFLMSEEVLLVVALRVPFARELEFFGSVVEAFELTEGVVKLLDLFDKVEIIVLFAVELVPCFPTESSFLL